MLYSNVGRGNYTLFATASGTVKFEVKGRSTGMLSIVAEEIKRR